MANVFTKFRKYQKPALAALGVMCMISFVFLDSCGNPGAGTRRREAVAETTQGTIYDTQLDVMRRERGRANAFIDHLLGSRGLDFFGSNSEQEVINSRLMAQRAEAMGIRVSDTAVNDFIAELLRLTQRQLSDSDVRRIVAAQGIEEADLFDILRTEIAVRTLKQTMFPDVPTTDFERRFMMQQFMGREQRVTPAESWEYFQRLHRQADVEVLPIYVKDFVGQISDPDERTLEDFFQKYRVRLPNPYSPEPGFQQPHRVALQYFTIDFQQFVEQSRSEITPEQIAAEYEKNQELYPYSGLIREDEWAPEEDPAVEGADPAPGQNAPAVPEGAARPSSEARRYLTAFRPAQDDAAQDDAAADAPANAPATPVTEIPADPAAAPGEDPTEPTMPLRSLRAIGSQYRIPRDIEGGVPPKYDPLWRVQGTIREKLARERADKKIEDTLAPVRQALARHAEEYRRWLVSDRQKNPNPPAAPRLQQFEVPGIQLHPQTPLWANYELYFDSPLGKARVQHEGSPQLLAAMAYGQLNEFDPVMATGEQGTRYFVWKTQDEMSSIPEKLDDPGIREQVVAAWKMEQARDLARQEADRTAAQAREKSQSLERMEVNGRTGERLEPFTWMTSSGFQVQYTQLEQLEFVGDDFLRAVFSLEAGEYGTAMNEPQTVAYVLHVRDYEYVTAGVRQSPEVLRQQFVNGGHARVQQIALAERARQYDQWVKSLQKEAGLIWIRHPHDER